MQQVRRTTDLKQIVIPIKEEFQSVDKYGSSEIFIFTSLKALFKYSNSSNLDYLLYVK